MLSTTTKRAAPLARRSPRSSVNATQCLPAKNSNRASSAQVRKRQVAPDARRVDLLACFIARAEARAFRFSIGDLTLAEAVDVLQRDAVRDGLVARIGQDGIQRILSDLFAPYRGE
jgi:hypothetical protein